MPIATFATFLAESNKQWSRNDFPVTVASILAVKKGGAVRVKIIDKMIDVLNTFGPKEQIPVEEWKAGGWDNFYYKIEHHLKDSLPPAAVRAKEQNEANYGKREGVRYNSSLRFDSLHILQSNADFWIDVFTRDMQLAQEQGSTDGVEGLKWAIQIIKEFAPVSEAIDAIRAKIVQPLTAAQKRAAEGKARITNLEKSKSGLVVVEALKGITDALIKKYEEAMYDDYVSSVNTYKALDDDELKKRPNFAKEMSQLPIWDYSAGNVHISRGRYPKTLKSDWDVRLTKMVHEFCLMVQENFVMKNAKKLGVIVTKKSAHGVELTKAPAPENLEVRGNFFSGELTFEFSDQSYFTVRNKAVWKYSTLGKPFVQFPTTFHNVAQADGTPFSNPSEDRMQVEFAES